MTCPIVVTRTWTLTDACGNATMCAQTINVDDTQAPTITSCAVTRNLEGCDVSVITGPVYSATSASSTEAEFENATNQGVASDACGITSVTYIDVASMTCPIVVTRTWTLTDACGNATMCSQTINVDDTQAPTITSCAVTRRAEERRVGAMSGSVYSATAASSTEAEFENATNQGVSSDACGITAVTYIDVASMTCPIVVTRTWTLTDACGNATMCSQTINVDDTQAPTITSCAVTRNVEGCDVSAITGPVYSATAASSTEAEFENATNQGVSSDACGIKIGRETGRARMTCPIVVTRTWTLTDACGNATMCSQTINVDDTQAPTITSCAVTRNVEGCDVSAITGPVYSATAASSTEAEFENATNQGVSSDACGITAVTYIDVASMTCPIVVTRTWTLTDACGNATMCSQTINVDDTQAPTITSCAVTRNVEGCDVSAITGPVYSATAASSTEAEFENATNQGVSSDACGITAVTYIDVASMTCPIVVTRTWTLTDACGKATTGSQSHE